MSILQGTFFRYLCFMILVTGGTGMVGAHLLLQLTEKGRTIRALKRKNSSLSITEKVFRYYEQSDLSKLRMGRWRPS